jgi:hypothetical protein
VECKNAAHLWLIATSPRAEVADEYGVSCSRCGTAEAECCILVRTAGGEIKLLERQGRDGNTGLRREGSFDGDAVERRKLMSAMALDTTKDRQR